MRVISIEIPPAHFHLVHSICIEFFKKEIHRKLRKTNHKGVNQFPVSNGPYICQNPESNIHIFIVSTTYVQSLKEIL